MTKSEMRMIRRDFINNALHKMRRSKSVWPMSTIKNHVRRNERVIYKVELTAYKMFP